MAGDAAVLVAQKSLAVLLGCPPLSFTPSLLAKKGKILKVKLRRVQSLAGEQFKAEYTVIKILEHRKAIDRLPISFQRNLA
ncbi:hypothetical protein [Pseudomonas sp. PA-4-8C]|uniref:hypothetical protein n=1 Tax=Pseudomonas sp. PA-4-8C TaxID=2665476 RepID=UPI001F2EB3A7|nr:hypothetical protein [Pseudomonas sp. PA-4-8C]